MLSSKYKHQSVRDLAWAILSPPLIYQAEHSCFWPNTQWYQRIFEETIPWFDDLDEDPSELEAMLDNQKDRRLGKYFETLWFYWFSKNPRYEVLANNLQIIFDGETLGEIDFIVLDKVTGKTVHWEVAVKFYLAVGDTSLMSNWHGPNRRDRLDIKFEHLAQRQSMLSKDPRVNEWLLKKGIKVNQCGVILKGRLYYSFEHEMASMEKHGIDCVSDDSLMKISAPRQCAPAHLRSWWFRERQFNERFDNQQIFLPLIKNGWMESIPTSNQKDYYIKSYINKTVADKVLRLPLHLQVCKSRHSWDRVFIVDETWSTNYS